MKAISSEACSKSSFATTTVQLDCFPPPSLPVPSKEYTYFLIEQPDYNNETITLNFSDKFLLEDSKIVGGLASLVIFYVYFLPKGTNVEDLSYKRTENPKNPYDCYDGPFLPSEDLAASIQGTVSSVGPRGDREGMLKFNIGNKGYTGLNGDVRLYIVVSLDFRYDGDGRDVGNGSFYVN